jgi:malic enzyme
LAQDWYVLQSTPPLSTTTAPKDTGSAEAIIIRSIARRSMHHLFHGVDEGKLLQQRQQQQQQEQQQQHQQQQQQQEQQQNPRNNKVTTLMIRSKLKQCIESEAYRDADADADAEDG